MFFPSGLVYQKTKLYVYIFVLRLELSDKLCDLFY